MRTALIIIVLMLTIGCQQTVPIYTCNVERWCFECDTTYILTCQDTVYGKMPHYGTYDLNDSVTIRVYGKMIGTAKIKKKYLK